MEYHRRGYLDGVCGGSGGEVGDVVYCTGFYSASNDFCGDDFGGELVLGFARIAHVRVMDGMKWERRGIALNGQLLGKWVNGKW